MMKLPLKSNNFVDEPVGQMHDMQAAAKEIWLPGFSDLDEKQL